MNREPAQKCGSSLSLFQFTNNRFENKNLNCERAFEDIELVIQSRLRNSEGGRETWISNFVPKFINCSGARIIINSICGEGDRDVIAFPTDVTVNSVAPKWGKRLPWPIRFILGYCLQSFRPRGTRSNIVIGVGGLTEALAILLGDFLTFRIRKRILWARTVYTKEKSNKLGKLRPLVVAIERFALRRFDALIVNGRDTADFYRHIRDDVVVIENSVEVERWSKSRTRYDGNDTLHFSFIGRLTNIKGIYQYFEAVARLASSGQLVDSNAKFSAVGPISDEVREDLKSTFPESDIEILAPISNLELQKFLRGVHVGVNLTFGTGDLMGGGVSNSLLEQLAAGKPQVVWDNPIYRNVVDENCALFAKERDAGDLASSLAEFSRRRLEIESMSEHAIRLAERYSWQKHLDRTITVINSVLAL